MRDPPRSYDEWRDILDQELGAVVLDDEGRRRCARDGRLGRPLSRQQAERYYAWNSFVRRAAGASGGH